MMSDYKSGGSLKHTNYEVHFKGEHVLHYPWKPYTGTTRKQEVEVKMLCHVTHFYEADRIICNNNGKDYQIEFKAFEKCGKDGSMETYRSQSPASIEPNDSTMYEPVSCYSNLFPGYYSWWSPVNERGSFFGTIEFSAQVDDLIECYKKAFDLPSKEIQFRCGGTLRYKKQACKVIIICLKEVFNLPDKEYPEMPMMTEREIKLQYDNPENFIYDTFAFMFHFPKRHMRMNCPEQAIICKEVYHNYKSCAKWRRCPNGNKEPPKLLKLKLENMKKRREEKAVGLKSAHTAQSSLEDEKLKEEMEDEKPKEEMEDKEVKDHPSMPKKRKRNDEDDNGEDDLGPILKKSGPVQF